MKLLNVAVTVWALCLTLALTPAPALSSPITDQDLNNIRQFAAAAMAKGRQLLRPRIPLSPVGDSQGSYSHYYGRHIPSTANIIPLPASHDKPEQFLKVHTAAAAGSPVVIAPAPVTAASIPVTPATPDPFQTFEQHMFGNAPAQPPRSQFNHHSFGPFHFFTNKSPPPPPRGPPPPAQFRHNQQLQAVMSGQHFATVAQQSRLRDQQQASLNAQFLPFGFSGKPTQYFGKVGGKGPQAITQSHAHLPPFQQRPIGGSFISQGRPADDLALIQPHLQPQEYTFTQLPGVKEPLTVGPETNPFNLPIHFEQVQQMPYAFPVQPQPLHLAMVVQSQEFPQYQFNPNPNFIDPSSALQPSSTPTPTQQQQNPNEVSLETSTSSTPQQQPEGNDGNGRGAIGANEQKGREGGGEEGIGEVIFESVRQTQQQEAAQHPHNSQTSQFTSSVGNSNKDTNVFFQAPLVFSQELFPVVTPTTDPPATSSDGPATATTEDSTKTTAQQVAIEFFKAKEVEGGSKNGGGALVTPSTSTSFISSSSKSVSSSVSTAVSHAPQKIKRLRKVKVSRAEAQQREKNKTNPNPPK